MSEFDSLSDSEWLDIASGRDSDDNESLSDQDSDRDEISSMPRSRRSSISNEDSTSSDVEAWEGFVSDGGEEPDIGMYPVPLSSPLGAEPIAVGFVPGRSEATDPTTAEEDQRVREALDQSFIGTLSASRSSTGAAHTSSTHVSIRDLRLSFPDPLTSSRNELNRSYEDVPSPTETTVSSSTDDDVHVHQFAPPPVSSPPLEDPGLLSITPEVHDQHHEVWPESERKDALEIVLYGSSSEVKWKFLQELIQKAAIKSGYAFINHLRENEQTQSLRLVKKSDTFQPFFNIIHINDRTLNATKAEIDNFDTPECSSLAIVYLPAAKLPILSWHNSYLPVLVPSITDLDDSVMLQGAEDDWELLAVPTSKTLKLGSGKSPVFDAEGVMEIDPTHAYELLRGIGRDTKKISALKPLTEHVKSMNAVTLFALMSIIMGFAFNTTFRPSTPSPTPTVNAPSSSNGHLWSFFAPQPNRSILIPSTSSHSAKGRTSGNTLDPSPSLKDMALSAFHPGGTSLSVTSPGSMSVIVASTSKSLMDTSATVSTTKCKQCATQPDTASEKPRTSTDVVLRSSKATSLSQIPSVKPSLPIAASRTDLGSSSTILLAGAERTVGIPKSTVGAVASAVANLKAHPVSDVLEKALSKVTGSDLAELAGAADEFLENLREQKDIVIRQGKGKVRAFGEQIQNLNDGMVKGNDRAKRRAKTFKKMGQNLAQGLAWGVQKELKARSSRAQEKAKEIRQAVVEGGVEVWKTYEKSLEGWESVLTEMNQQMSGEDAENIHPKAKAIRNCLQKKDSLAPPRWAMRSPRRQMKKANGNTCV